MRYAPLSAHERELIQLLAKLPKRGKQPILPLCACDKMVPLSNFKSFNTGAIVALDNVCPGCQKTFQGLANIVCCTCRTVVARIKPGKDPVDGFVFRADRTYHTETCGACNPGQKQTLIIEKFLYQKKYLGQAAHVDPTQNQIKKL